MLSLQARVPIQRFRPLLFLGKLISFSMVAFLLCAVWVGVCFLKREMNHRGSKVKSVQISTATSMPANALPVKANQPLVSNAAAQKKESRLVYFCATDKENYHVAKHLGSPCTRIALSESAALERGLKPCSHCFPE
jgi:hypothetical protein